MKHLRIKNMKRKDIWKQVRLFYWDPFNSKNSQYVRHISIFSPCKSDVRRIGLISPCKSDTGVPNLLSYLRGAYGKHTEKIVPHNWEWAPRTAPIILDWVERLTYFKSSADVLTPVALMKAMGVMKMKFAHIFAIRNMTLTIVT